jgi:hypothetical protein
MKSNSVLELTTRANYQSRREAFEMILKCPDILRAEECSIVRYEEGFEPPDYIEITINPVREQVLDV